MSSNPWGADWGRYHKQKRDKKDHARARRTSRPCVYLLYKIRSDLWWFGTPGLVVKAGKSQRNALIRASEQQHKGFHLKAAWDIPADQLSACEREVLAQLRTAFGEPFEGIESFLVPGCTIDEVQDLVEQVVYRFGPRDATWPCPR